VTTTYDEAMAEAARLGLMAGPTGKATDRCQCPTCGEVFSTEANFDRHLTPGRNADGFEGEWCREPSTVGLVQHARGWWLQPGSEVAVLTRAGNAGAIERVQVA
jgi:hypothetical protein